MILTLLILINVLNCIRSKLNACPFHTVFMSGVQWSKWRKSASGIRLCVENNTSYTLHYVEKYLKWSLVNSHFRKGIRCLAIQKILKSSVWETDENIFNFFFKIYERLGNSAFSATLLFSAITLCHPKVVITDWNPPTQILKKNLSFMMLGCEILSAFIKEKANLSS